MDWRKRPVWAGTTSRPRSSRRLCRSHCLAVAWQLSGRSFDDGPFVKQTCGNPACVRPDHLAIPSLEEKFWSRVEKSEGCWLWMGGIYKSGYGEFSYAKNVNVLAHRMAWEL